MSIFLKQLTYILSAAFMIALVFTSRTWTTLLATIVILCGLMYASDKYLYKKHLAVFRYAWVNISQHKL